jgi:hypothetical protein
MNLDSGTPPPPYPAQPAPAAPGKIKLTAERRKWLVNEGHFQRFYDDTEGNEGKKGDKKGWVDNLNVLEAFTTKFPVEYPKQTVLEVRYHIFKAVPVLISLSLSVLSTIFILTRLASTGRLSTTALK